MKKYLHPFIILSVGGIIGIAIYHQFGRIKEPEISFQDTILVKDASASSSMLAQVNEELNNSRATSITRAVEKISPAIVSVTVIQVREYIRRSPFSMDPFFREFFPEYFKDSRDVREIQSMGSGFIISEDGYILTNEHVIEDASKIVITMAGGNEASAEIVGTDPKSDIALLKINKNNLPYVKFGNSEKVILGEWAIAAGNPFGLFKLNNRATVTVGVISALDRDFGQIEGRYYQDMIQTDASINTGNSGGPLCNALGEVIGMNTFIYTGSRYNEGSVGIGFAIPINRIAKLLDDLKKFHKVDRDFWIGIKVRTLDQFIARKMDYDNTYGVLVTYIDKKSPAEKAGIQLGDIIIEIEQNKIENEDNILQVIYGADFRVGDILNLKVWREGEIKTLKMTLERFSNS